MRVPLTPPVGPAPDRVGCREGTRRVWRRARAVG